MANFFPLSCAVVPKGDVHFVVCSILICGATKESPGSEKDGN